MADMSQTRLRVLRGSIGHVLELHGTGNGFGFGSGYGYGSGYGSDSGYGSGGYGYGNKRSDNGLVPLPDSNREEVT